jgi:hypothetical protein
MGLVCSPLHRAAIWDEAAARHEGTLPQRRAVHRAPSEPTRSPAGAAGHATPVITPWPRSTGGARPRGIRHPPPGPAPRPSPRHPPPPAARPPGPPAPRPGRRPGRPGTTPP